MNATSATRPNPPLTLPLTLASLLVTTGATAANATTDEPRMDFRADTTNRADPGTPKAWLDVAFGDNSFVTVGSAGAIATSQDGERWIRRESGVGSNLQGVEWGADRWIVVGAAGTILTSPDLGHWTRGHSPLSVTLRAVAFAECRYVIVGDSGTVLTSENAVTWTARASGTGNSLRGVAHAHDAFWAVGADRTFLRSKEGLRWSAIMPGGAWALPTSPRRTTASWRWAVAAPSPAGRPTTDGRGSPSLEIPC